MTRTRLLLGVALIVAACGEQTAKMESNPQASADPSPTTATLVTEFVGRFDAATGKLTFEKAPAVQVQGLTEVTVSQNGVANDNPPGTIELQTHEVDIAGKSCPEGAASIDAMVMIRSQYPTELTNVYVEMQRVTPSGYAICNNAAAFDDVSPTNGGLLRYGTIAPNGTSYGDDIWSFANGATGGFTFRARVKADWNHCVDGVQNVGETGVDCGGSCAACPPEETCSDGIQNQGETGIDCGGPCEDCPLPSCGTNQIVIYQIYGAGGNNGATYKNDFVVLHNRSATRPASLSGLSIQQASATGSSWTRVNLPNSTIPAGGYFLVSLQGGANGVDLPPVDYVGGTINMGGSGKIALANVTTNLSGTCPLGANVIDFIGFGTAGCSEGSSAAPAITTTTWAVREGDGCTDTNVNLADFKALSSPVPANSATAPVKCGCE